MDSNLIKISNVLLELKQASINSTVSTIRSVMKKYNMLFLGENFSSIYSVELLHYLNSTLDFKIDTDEFNKLIPLACKSLNMNFIELTEASNVGKPNPPTDCYNIILW